MSLEKEETLISTFQNENTHTHTQSGCLNIYLTVGSRAGERWHLLRANTVQEQNEDGEQEIA